MLAQTLVPEDRSVSSAAASSSALTTPPLPSGAEQPGDLDFLNSVLSEEAGSEAEGHRRAEDAPSPGPSPPEPPPPPRQWQSLRRSLSALRQPWSPARTRALWAGWNGCYVAGALGAAVSDSQVRSHGAAGKQRGAPLRLHRHRCGLLHRGHAV
mmetsp:Transcript_21070/g.62395  ORF Transcript_21070/g.62395 Transcript_21070/m.62395 type:complete len:154 (-) Transcript_21070:531-992(-)